MCESGSFFRLVPHVSGSVLWANLNLLFWLSLIPFTMAWMNEHGLAPVPVAAYGASLLLCALSWHVLQATIVRAQGPTSPLRQAVGCDLKGKISPVVYLAEVVLAFVSPVDSHVLCAALAAAWLIPDRRVETALRQVLVDTHR